jgi:hypothetical protein
MSQLYRSYHPLFFYFCRHRFRISAFSDSSYDPNFLSHNISFYAGNSFEDETCSRLDPLSLCVYSVVSRFPVEASIANVITIST